MDAGNLIPVLVLNGPNLNLLGEREPQIYGRRSLIAPVCAGTIAGFGWSSYTFALHALRDLIIPDTA